LPVGNFNSWKEGLRVGLTKVTSRSIKYFGFLVGGVNGSMENNMVRRKIDIHLETNKVLRLISVHENIFTIKRVADELALRLSDVRLAYRY
jgi:hypothetical protein